jgi:hypothetical protein
MTETALQLDEQAYGQDDDDDQEDGRTQSEPQAGHRDSL